MKQPVLGRMTAVNGDSWIYDAKHEYWRPGVNNGLKVLTYNFAAEVLDQTIDALLYPEFGVLTNVESSTRQPPSPFASYTIWV